MATLHGENHLETDTQSVLFYSMGYMSEPSKWSKGLVVTLLEVTHGQWLNQDIHMHDAISGALVTAKKEELQQAIEDELGVCVEGLVEEDLNLLEINL